jgi:phosphoribosylaminoimidazole-succinocarboxamide synthase
MEDAKIYNKDICIMYADFKGALNAAAHRIMFKHMRQVGMPSTFVDTCEQLHGASITNYNTPYGPTPSLDI